MHQVSKLTQGAKAGTAPPQETITMLIDSCRDDTTKASLGFAKAWFSAAGQDAQLDLLFADPSNFAYYAQWTDGKLMLLKEFASPQTLWRSVPIDQVVKGAYLLTGADSQYKRCPNKAVQGVLQSFQELKANFSGVKGGDEVEKTSQLVHRAVLLEFYRDKLGTEVPLGDDTAAKALSALEGFELPDNEKRLRLLKVIRSHCAKLKTEMGPVCAALLVRFTTSEEKDTAEREAAVAKETAAAKEADVAKRVAVKEAEAASLASAFVPGVKVTTSLPKQTKQKDLWDGKKCEVVAIKKTGRLYVSPKAVS